jgi:hypothetical protein
MTVCRPNLVAVHTAPSHEPSVRAVARPEALIVIAKVVLAVTSPSDRPDASTATAEYAVRSADKMKLRDGLITSRVAVGADRGAAEAVVAGEVGRMGLTTMPGLAGRRHHCLAKAVVVDGAVVVEGAVVFEAAAEPFVGDGLERGPGPDRSSCPR